MAEMTVFYVPRTAAKQEWNLASIELTNAYTDFIFSRKAMQCSPATLHSINIQRAKFLKWVESQSG